MMDIGKNIKRKNINGIAVGVYKLKKIEFLKYVFVGNIIFKYFRKAGFVEPLKYFEGKNLNTYISKKFVWTDIDNYSDLKKSKKLILKDIL
jgi:choline kinase